jgi:hypothetical protein
MQEAGILGFRDQYKRVLGVQNRLSMKLDSEPVGVVMVQMLQ